MDIPVTLGLLGPSWVPTTLPNFRPALVIHFTCPATGHWLPPIGPSLLAAVAAAQSELICTARETTLKLLVTVQGGQAAFWPTTCRIHSSLSAYSIGKSVPLWSPCHGPWKQTSHRQMRWHQQSPGLPSTRQLLCGLVYTPISKAGVLWLQKYLI